MRLTDSEALRLAERAAKIAGAKGDDARRCALQAAHNYAEDRAVEMDTVSPRSAAAYRRHMAHYHRLLEAL